MNWRPFTLPATLPVTRIFSHYPTRTLPEVKKPYPSQPGGGSWFHNLNLKQHMFFVWGRGSLYACKRQYLRSGNRILKANVVATLLWTKWQHCYYEQSGNIVTSQTKNFSPFNHFWATVSQNCHKMQLAITFWDQLKLCQPSFPRQCQDFGSVSLIPTAP